MRRLAAAVAGLTVLLAAAGCGIDAGSRRDAAKPEAAPSVAAADVVRRAADRVAAVRTYRARIALRFAGGPDPSSSRVDVRARLRPALAFELAVRVPIGTGGSGATEVRRFRAVGKATYRWIPRTWTRYPESVRRTWVRAPVRYAQVSELPFGEDTIPFLLHDVPTAVRLMTASTDVRRVGSERVMGVPTTRYSGSYDQEKAVRALRGRVGMVMRINTDGGTPVRFDLWVDDQGLPRRLATRTALTSAGDPAGTRTATTTLLDVDRPVTIKPPPRDRTIDYEEFADLNLRLPPPGGTS